MKSVQKLSLFSTLVLLTTACSSFPTQKDPPFMGVMNRQDVSVVDAELPEDSPLNTMGVPEAWKKTTGKMADGNRVVIAVVGTGIDYNIPDLREALYVNTGELGTRAENQSDDDWNGYADDLIGYDFYSGDSNPYDWHGHDTFTASLIASTGRTNKAVRGVAPNASLLIARYIGPEGTANGFDAYEALRYASNVEGVRVIYFNWPAGGFIPDPFLGDLNPIIAEQIQIASAKNILVVIPAGNSANADEMPAFLKAVSNLDNVLVVGGATASGRMAPRSNAGKLHVSVAAPLENATGYYPGGVVSQDLHTTSVSAAYVAGLAALVTTLPGYGSASKVKQALLSLTAPSRDGTSLDVLSEGVISVADLK